MATIAELMDYLSQFDEDKTVVLTAAKAQDDEVALDIFFDLKS